MSGAAVPAPALSGYRCYVDDDLGALTAAWIAAGLYDPAAPRAADRLELLRWLHGRNVTLQQMEDAASIGQLNALGGDLSLRPGPRLTTAQMAQVAAMDEALVADIRRASGFPPARADEAVYTAEDVEMFKIFSLADGFFSRDELLRLTRVMGSSLRRIAEAAGEMFLQDVEAPMVDETGHDLAIATANLEAIELARAASGVFAPMFRAHLELATRINRSAARSEDYTTLVLAVGFVDLSGFTHRSSLLKPAELQRLVAGFEASAHELVTDLGGRLVKLIGDEVMFTCVPAEQACRIALALLQGAPEGTTARGGVAFGPALASGGDVYGDVVNLASRLVDLAVPGEVLVDTGLVDAAPAVTVEPAGRRMVKGFADPVRVWSLTP